MIAKPRSTRTINAIFGPLQDSEAKTPECGGSALCTVVRTTGDHEKASCCAEGEERKQLIKVTGRRSLRNFACKGDCSDGVS